MNIIAFKALLETKTTDDVYIDFVPEGKTIPALSFTHITDGWLRILNGHKSGVWDSWRVLIVGNSRAECDAILTSLDELDNTKSNDFSKVFIMAKGNLISSPSDKTRTAFLDIKTYG